MPDTIQSPSPEELRTARDRSPPPRFRPGEYRPLAEGADAYRAEIARLQAVEGKLRASRDDYQQRRDALLHMPGAVPEDLDALERTIGFLTSDIPRAEQLRASFEAKVPGFVAAEVREHAQLKADIEQHHSRALELGKKIDARYAALAEELAALYRESKALADARQQLARRLTAYAARVAQHDLSLRDTITIHVNANLPGMDGENPFYDGLRLEHWPNLPPGYRVVHIGGVR